MLRKHKAFVYCILTTVLLVLAARSNVQSPATGLLLGASYFGAAFVVSHIVTGIEIKRNTDSIHRVYIETNKRARAFASAFSYSIPAVALNVVYRNPWPAWLYLVLFATFLGISFRLILEIPKSEIGQKLQYFRSHASN